MRTGFVPPREDLREQDIADTQVTVVSTPSSAAGSAWPWGNPFKQAREAGTYELPADTERRFQDLVADLTGRQIVTLDGLQSDEGSVLVFLGHTDDAEVLIAVDHRPAALLLDSLGTLDEGDTIVEVEGWQIISRVAR